MKYFTLNPNTFIWIKKDQVLLYGSHNGNHLLCDCSGGVWSVCEKLMDESHLYCVSIDETDENIVSFVNRSVELHLGMVSEENGYDIAIPPMLKIQHNQSRIEQDEEDMYFPRYLSSLTIYVGGDCLPNNYHSQTDYPFPSRQIVSFESISEFILTNNRNTLSTIKVVFPEYNEETVASLLSYLKSVSDKTQIVLRYPEVLKNKDFFEEISAKIGKLIIICEPDDDFEILQENYRYNLITRSDSDYSKWQAIFDGETLQYEIVPIYENNREFYEENILITPEELLANKQSKKMIHIHQTLNLFNWGKLYIYPDGKIYSKCGGEVIGNISEPLNAIIGRELRTNHSWLHIRNFSICQECLFQFLCPNPAPFEYESSDGAMLACKRNCSSMG